MSNPEPRSGGLREAVIEVIRTIYDPEIPVNIYDMGLVYGIDIDEEQNSERDHHPHISHVSGRGVVAD